MDESTLNATADRLATAAEALERALARFDASHQALSEKVDRIIAAVEQSDERAQLEARIADLERQNKELKAAKSEPAARKTLPPLVTALLAKNGVESQSLDVATLDKTLAALSIEQRIAVKAQMARAGIID